MTASEYPDTLWMGLPKAFGVGRDGKRVRLSVVHYTAGASGPGAARNGAAYDKRRTDGTSCHVFHDSEESVQEVWTRDRSNSAFSYGNRLGIHHELCATNAPRSWWLTGVGLKTLQRAARAAAWDCRTYRLEPRRLTTAEVSRTWSNNATAVGGLCGHVDITYAFSVGDHIDPGAGFPWREYEDEVRRHILGPTVVTEDDMNRFVAHLLVPATASTKASEGWVWSNGDTWRSIPDWDTKLKCSALYGKPDVEVNSEKQLAVICGKEEQ